MYVGIGYDSHHFDAARELVLGGVRIPGEPGLAGHSDGDAVAHAVIDALLGAAGLSSIGTLFPDDDPAFAGADSLKLLERAVAAVHERGLCVVNVDATVIAERPRIAPHAADIAARLAEALRVVPARVCVKGKSNEGMGFIGRGEGLAVLAVASLAPNPPAGTTNPPAVGAEPPAGLAEPPAVGAEPPAATAERPPAQG